jgi:hypothetical protein
VIGVAICRFGAQWSVVESSIWSFVFCPIFYDVHRGFAGQAAREARAFAARRGAGVLGPRPEERSRIAGGFLQESIEEADPLEPRPISRQ